MTEARYDHVQQGRLYPLIHATGLGTLLGGLSFTDQPYVQVALGVAALGIVLAGLGSHRLRVRDEGDALALRFGPLPVLSKRIPYASVRSVERARTTLLDGFGVHWLPFRGWTWNLWGFDCVRVVTDTQTLRIGSDDAEGLLAFLRGRTGLGDGAWADGELAGRDAHDAEAARA